MLLQSSGKPCRLFKVRSETTHFKLVQSAKAFLPTYVTVAGIFKKLSFAQPDIAKLEICSNPEPKTSFSRLTRSFKAEFAKVFIP